MVGRGRVFPPVLLLLLLLVGPSATFRFSFAADTRIDVYNAISRGGFFSQTWDVHQSRAKMRVRQVPGDGSCLFHAIYVALSYATNGTHPSEDYEQMCRSAGLLRQMALDYLSRDPNRVLTVTYNQDMRSCELLEMTSKEMGLSPDQYLLRLRDPKEWGGGLEIVALANALERPIFLYELKPAGFLFWSKFVFKKMVECGMPKFANHKSLHILIADCDFPDCVPYFYNKTGNHFLALFPCEEDEEEEGSPEKEYEVDSRSGDGSLRGTKSSLRGRVWRRLQDGIFRRHQQQQQQEQPASSGPLRSPRGGFMRFATRNSELVQSIKC